MKTYSLKGSEQTARSWYLIDVKDAVLGRAASITAKLLRAKHDPRCTPHMDHGAAVVIINAQYIHLTGKKDKIYYRHTGYPGGIKSITSSTLLDKKSHKNSPRKVIEHAVKGMLGKNGPLLRQRMRHLYVYGEAEHPHIAQNPQTLDVMEWNPKNKNRRTDRE